MHSVHLCSSVYMYHRSRGLCASTASRSYCSPPHPAQRGNSAVMRRPRGLLFNKHAVLLACIRTTGLTGSAKIGAHRYITGAFAFAFLPHPTAREGESRFTSSQIKCEAPWSGPLPPSFALLPFPSPTFFPPAQPSLKLLSKWSSVWSWKWTNVVQ